MRKHFVFSAMPVMILVILGLLVTGRASSQTMPSGTQQTQLTIVNNTGYTIWYAYISPSTDNEWGPDRLAGDQIINNRESVTLNLLLPVAERYDIMLEDSDGDTYTKGNLRITANTRIVFTFDDFDDTD